MTWKTLTGVSPDQMRGTLKEDSTRLFSIIKPGAEGPPGTPAFGDLSGYIVDPSMIQLIIDNQGSAGLMNTQTTNAVLMIGELMELLELSSRGSSDSQQIDQQIAMIATLNDTIKKLQAQIVEDEGTIATESSELGSLCSNWNMAQTSLSGIGDSMGSTTEDFAEMAQRLGPIQKGLRNTKTALETLQQTQFKDLPAGCPAQ